MEFLTALVDAGRLAGWARAITAALLGTLIVKLPWLVDYLDPATQTAIGTLVAGIIVGVWSQLAKSNAASVAVLAAENPAVEKVVMKSKTLADSIPSNKVVSK